MEDREERTAVLMDRVLEAHEMMGANDYQVVFDELEKANQTIKELSHSIDVKIDKLMCKDRQIEKYQKVKKVLFLLLEVEKKTEQLQKVTNDKSICDNVLNLN